MPNLFLISNLSASVSAKPIINGLDLQLRQGEIVALMGPNGSGKSTLANVLAGHPTYQINTGQVTLNGQDITHNSPDERAKQGLFLAFQYPVEVPGVRVLNFLWEAYKLRFIEANREFKKITQYKLELERLAKIVGLKSEFLMRGLNENFSGGEKKRLEIVQMLALQPKYAILDETDSGLDIDAIKAVAAGINQAVKAYKTGILVITHYQRILDYLTPDRVEVMVAGKIVKSGDASLVKELEKSGYKQWTKLD